VRRAIAELGRTMPENLPTAESIKKLERAEKKRLAAPKKSKKDDEAQGLLCPAGGAGRTVSSARITDSTRPQ